MFPDAVWSYTLHSNRLFSNCLRWVNTKLSKQWLDKDRVQDISCMPETGCASLSLRGMFYSCRVNCSFFSVPDLCGVKSFLSDAYCVIHRYTHLHHTLASSSVHTHFLSNSLTSNGKQRARRSKITQEVSWGYNDASIALQKWLIFKDEELTHCSGAVGWVITVPCWSSDSGDDWDEGLLNFLIWVNIPYQRGQTSCRYNPTWKSIS